MGAMKPQSAQANKVTVLAVPLVIAVVECAAMLPRTGGWTQS